MTEELAASFLIQMYMYPTALLGVAPFCLIPPHFKVIVKFKFKQNGTCLHVSIGVAKPLFACIQFPLQQLQCLLQTLLEKVTVY